MPRGGGLLIVVVGMILVCRVGRMSQRELLDVESVAGHLLKDGQCVRVLGAHRRELFPDEMLRTCFRLGGDGRGCRRM